MHLAIFQTAARLLAGRRRIFNARHLPAHSFCHGEKISVATANFEQSAIFEFFEFHWHGSASLRPLNVFHAILCAEKVFLFPLRKATIPYPFCYFAPCHTHQSSRSNSTRFASNLSISSWPKFMIPPEKFHEVYTNLPTSAN